MAEYESPLWLCPYCGFKDSLWNTYYWKCPRCGKPLRVIYEKDFNPSGRGIARYSSMLPFTPTKTRGEGSTPLVVERINGSILLFKLEYLNPSGSFKDRGTALSIYYGFKIGYLETVEDTSGNTGISVALYSKLYGLKPIVIMPKTAPKGKKALVRALGAELVETPDRSTAATEVHRLIKDRYYVAHTWSYFYIIGASTIAFEVYEEAGIPDYVIVPIGSGGLVLGLIHGFLELVRLKVASKIPRLIGVQGYSACPVYQALRGSIVSKKSSHYADGIMVLNPPRLNEIVDVMKKYGYEIVLVDNEEILDALYELYNMGFIVEPTSAAVWVAYKRIKDKVKGSTILLPLTGSGLKTLIEREPPAGYSPI